jgi:hypothetical protein
MLKKTYKAFIELLLIKEQTNICDVAVWSQIEQTISTNDDIFFSSSISRSVVSSNL